ncbi:MAG: hypothetical protein ABJE10_03260 [bacterium]
MTTAVVANLGEDIGRYWGAKASLTKTSSMSAVRSTLRAALVLASAALLGGCPFMSSTATPAVSTPSSIAVAQGNGQSAQAGKALPSAIVLRVVDENGHGVAKQIATLVVTIGGGTLSPATVVSDTLGEMRFVWTLGQAGPAQSLLATVNGTISVSVGATAIFPAQVIIAQGQLQSGKVATALKNDIVIRVVGPANQPMIGVAVAFTVTGGAGGITPQSGVTNALGELSTKWTLGAAAGSNTLVATAGQLPIATINATATP